MSDLDYFTKGSKIDRENTQNREDAERECEAYLDQMINELREKYPDYVIIDLSKEPLDKRLFERTITISATNTYIFTDYDTESKSSRDGSYTISGNTISPNYSTYSVFVTETNIKEVTRSREIKFVKASDYDAFLEAKKDVANIPDTYYEIEKDYKMKPPNTFMYVVYKIASLASFLCSFIYLFSCYFIDKKGESDYLVTYALSLIPGYENFVTTHINGLIFLIIAGVLCVYSIIYDIYLSKFLSYKNKKGRHLLAHINLLIALLLASLIPYALRDSSYVFCLHDTANFKVENALAFIGWLLGCIGQISILLHIIAFILILVKIKSDYNRILICIEARKNFDMAKANRTIERANNFFEHVNCNRHVNMKQISKS